MIRTGRTQELKVLRSTPQGLFLGDDEAEVLLPKAECPASVNEGGSVKVFVHRDAQHRLVATTREVRIEAGQFAPLRVRSVDAAGAHMEWGLEPDLLVPPAEQRKPLTEGRWYLVRVVLDERSDRLYASTRIEDFLSNNDLIVKKGEVVQLVVYAKSELGISVIVNNIHQGLVHANELFRTVSIGDRITGYVKTVREDNKLDITLQPIGYRQYIDVNTEMLAKRLRATGFLPLTDKSDAEFIHAEFGISKKAFKKALGALYKDRVVRLEESGVIWIGDR
ncbi:MAG: GntR family transcriptional regulator [Flavobacteriales bacterium]|nr:GntR family transcriptional regulator [Flavobacteriales bacterium]